MSCIDINVVIMGCPFMRFLFLNKVPGYSESTFSITCKNHDANDHWFIGETSYIDLPINSLNQFSCLLWHFYGAESLYSFHFFVNIVRESFPGIFNHISSLKGKVIGRCVGASPNFCTRCLHIMIFILVYLNF